jgi:hypothetical protein
MKKTTDKINVIIPKFQTQCGETVWGAAECNDDIVTIKLDCQGSRLLFHVVTLLTSIIHNRHTKYYSHCDVIFWRVNELPLEGNRKDMAQEILTYIKSFSFRR